MKPEAKPQRVHQKVPMYLGDSHLKSSTARQLHIIQQDLHSGKILCGKAAGGHQNGRQACLGAVGAKQAANCGTVELSLLMET